MKFLIAYLYPFNSISRSIDGVPDYLVESIRMKNRWRLNEIVPFIWRWLLVLGFLGLCIFISDQLPNGLISFFIHIILITAWWFSLFFMGLLIWIYSLHPR